MSTNVRLNSGYRTARRDRSQSFRRRHPDFFAGRPYGSALPTHDSFGPVRTYDFGDDRGTITIQLPGRAMVLRRVRLWRGKVLSDGASRQTRQRFLQFLASGPAFRNSSPRFRASFAATHCCRLQRPASFPPGNISPEQLGQVWALAPGLTRHLPRPDNSGEGVRANSDTSRGAGAEW